MLLISSAMKTRKASCLVRSASLAKGVSQLGIKPGSKVLYLGCASGTTASHVADIIGHENAQGFLFGLDFAPRVLREFVHLCEDRKNMTAIFGFCKDSENKAFCIASNRLQFFNDDDLKLLDKCDSEEKENFFRVFEYVESCSYSEDKSCICTKNNPSLK